MSIKQIAKQLFTDGNKINEGNIAVMVGLVLLCFDEAVLFFKTMSWIDVAFVGIHMIFIFLMCKTEHSKPLEAKDVLKSAEKIINA